MTDREKREAKALAIVRRMQPKDEDPKHTFEGTSQNGSCIYFIYCAGRIKIGRTSDIVRRLPDLVTPFPTTLLLMVPGGPDEEMDFHNQFACDRAHREWFRLSRDLRKFLLKRLKPKTARLLEGAEAAFQKHVS
jgi:hypothetical protein